MKVYEHFSKIVEPRTWRLLITACTVAPTNSFHLPPTRLGMWSAWTFSPDLQKRAHPTPNIFIFFIFLLAVSHCPNRLSKTQVPQNVDYRQPDLSSNRERRGDSTIWENRPSRHVLYERRSIASRWCKVRNPQLFSTR